MRRLVVCCDGTWQDVAADGNVARLYRAHRADRGSPPARYVPGVGTSRLDPIGNLRAGLTGAGLDRSITDGYRYLVDTYRPGDRISLFGFSRGAYTARSLAGMVGRVGIVDGTALDPAARADAVRRAYRRYRDLRTRPADDGWSTGLVLAYDSGEPTSPIEFVGVWDTVGALGIPEYVGIPDLVHSREHYTFLDVTLDPRIPVARHAVSLDELRGAFRPTLWDPPAPGQDVRQVWFPGDHGDVGGGYAEKGLSDAALAWMAAQATHLTFELSALADFAPSPTGPAHTLADGLVGAALEIAFQPRPRTVPRVDTSRPEPAVSEVALQRQAAQGYRRTTTLAAGQTARLTVPADRVWTATGLWLEKGEYRFTAEGRWSSAGRSCGPAGDTRWHLSGGAFSAVLDRLEGMLRRVVGNPRAELAFSRRHNDLAWFSLVGSVANAPTPEADDTVIPIGTGATAEVRDEGYLYAYPNDALGCYGNNAGEIALTVGRLS
ncbi:hypothetical protein GCM10023215_42080 [Pseudonocardia yuanmonensis]|uniref:T6SS Phospholipase effector Tle1-like catalytic domain-containing protein n=1 Tax=Pseudonocardia yuanmonensis TaxID=1095914 RepID=A0ABP8X4J9_9PSEU